jgi:hypothetical protein
VAESCGLRSGRGFKPGHTWIFGSDFVWSRWNHRKNVYTGFIAYCLELGAGCLIDQPHRDSWNHGFRLILDHAAKAAIAGLWPNRHCYPGQGRDYDREVMMQITLHHDTPKLSLCLRCASAGSAWKLRLTRAKNLAGGARSI